MKNYLLFILSLVTFCTFIGCRSAKQAAQLIREVRTDTLYLSNVQYDSIFVFNDRQLDRSRDTLLIRETNTEFRYKLLRDTVYKVQIDSIPYEVRIETVREVPRPKTWFDRLCRYAFFLLCGALLFFVYRCIRKFI